MCFHIWSYFTGYYNRINCYSVQILLKYFFKSLSSSFVNIESIFSLTSSAAIFIGSSKAFDLSVSFIFINLLSFTSISLIIRSFFSILSRIPEIVEFSISKKFATSFGLSMSNCHIHCRTPYWTGVTSNSDNLSLTILKTLCWEVVNKKLIHSVILIGNLSFLKL